MKELRKGGRRVDDQQEILLVGTKFVLCFTSWHVVPSGGDFQI